MTKIALVTGANKGIGHEVARQLCVLGYTVLVGARDATRRAAAADRLSAAGGDARFVPLDVTDTGSVAQAAALIARDNGLLDVLVNNAAIKLECHPALPSQSILALVRETFETDVFCLISVTLAMLPLLRKSLAARIVNVSSGLGSLTLAATVGTK